MNEARSFTAAEYQVDGSHKMVAYGFSGSKERGWTVRREGEETLSLGPGYVPVPTRYCGVCSTDLARRFLPYPLPQIIGHEVVGEHEEKPVVVEINASHLARGLEIDQCPFCSNGLDTQCPERITMGIDRLPGGFSPLIMAPQHAIIPIPDCVDPMVAALTEPLAATLQGVEATYPENGEEIAVLGPRRLGMLLLVALAGFRKRQGLQFSITALARHDGLLETARRLGADRAVNTRSQTGQYDVVFDTTGSVSGFELALGCARRVVHLKSTHGQVVMGMEHLSDMVVDELALLPYSAEALQYGWPIETKPRTNPNVLVMPGIDLTNLPPEHTYHQMSVEEAAAKYDEMSFPNSPVPRFDLAIVNNLNQADRVIRPGRDWTHSLIRPRGAILTMPLEQAQNPLQQALNRGLQIHTSRCGNFRRALDILEQNPELAAALKREMITHQFGLQQIDEAFATAADSKKSIKVIVDVGHSEKRGL